MSDPESSETDDGFTTVINQKTGEQDPTYARFDSGSGTMRVPPSCLECRRGDWHVKGDVLRCRLGDRGEFLVNHPSKRTRALSAVGLYQAIGRTLSGRYPITRIDGCDLYIDISEPAS
jgi:hypothetical protein